MVEARACGWRWHVNRSTKSAWPCCLWCVVRAHGRTTLGVTQIVDAVTCHVARSQAHSRAATSSRGDCPGQQQRTCSLILLILKNQLAILKRTTAVLPWCAA